MDLDPQTYYGKLEQPDDPDALVWRHMSMTKLVDVLCNKRVWYSRADFLNDPFEGSVPVSDRRQMDALNDALREVSGQDLVEGPPRTSSVQESAYVSCWSLQKHESNALWKVYCPDGEGIAIVTTYRKLKGILPKGHTIGKVQYRNYNDSSLSFESDFIAHVMHKRLPFEYEQEVRCVATRLDIESPHLFDVHGFGVEIDPEVFIDRIVIGPYAPRWMRSAVLSLVRKLGLSTPVERSSLSEEARFPPNLYLPQEIERAKILELAQLTGNYDGVMKRTRELSEQVNKIYEDLDKHLQG